MRKLKNICTFEDHTSELNLSNVDDDIKKELDKISQDIEDWKDFIKNNKIDLTNVDDDIKKELDRISKIFSDLNWK